MLPHSVLVHEIILAKFEFGDFSHQFLKALPKFPAILYVIVKLVGEGKLKFPCLMWFIVPLTQWIDLHLNKSIPASLLLLSRTLFLPEDTETSDALKATITNLPENIVCSMNNVIAEHSYCCVSLLGGRG